MNNKTIGTAFERELCDLLAQAGFWVHFIVPDARGAQPFDIIAVKNAVAYAIDCKTCVAGTFNISRMEDNQIMAFEKWKSCSNTDPFIAVKHDEQVFFIKYEDLKRERSIKLNGKGEHVFCNIELI